MATTRKLAILAVFSVAFQLGLAILGWGGWRAFSSHPALVALGIMTVVLTVVALFTGANLSSGEQEDRGNRWVLIVFSLMRS